MLKTILKQTKTNRHKKRTGRTLGQMVKAKLCRQNHIKKHSDTHSQREKKEKEKYIYKKKKEEESNQINKQVYR